MSRDPALNSSSSHRSTRPSRSCCRRHSSVLMLEIDGMEPTSTVSALHASKRIFTTKELREHTTRYALGNMIRELSNSPNAVCSVGLA